MIPLFKKKMFSVDPVVELSDATTFSVSFHLDPDF